ncbi:hypothetical protein AVEN_80445-1, partial [Araneus ventricosus]
ASCPCSRKHYGCCTSTQVERLPPDAPVPVTVTVTEPVDWTWNIDK